MYAREGFVPLTGLWRDFESKFLSLCKKRALASLQTDRHSSDFMFGTALDLCEDTFLRTFDAFRLLETAKSSPNGGIRIWVRLIISLGARLFITVMILTLGQMPPALTRTQPRVRDV